MAPPIEAQRAARGESTTRRSGARVWRRRLALAGLLLVAAAGIALALRPRAIVVDLATIERGPLEVRLEEDGVARVRSRFQVSSPVRGLALRVTHARGDRVEPGEVLATIVPEAPTLLDARTTAEAVARREAAEAAIARAEATVEAATIAHELATRTAERAKALGAVAALPSQEVEVLVVQARLRAADVEAAKRSVHVARHEAEIARAMLERARSKRPATPATAAIAVVAPIGGRVLRVLHESEGVVGPGTPLVELGDPADLEVALDLLTADAVHVRPGQAARVVRWGGPPLAARVRLVEPSATTKVSALGVEEQRVDVVLDLEPPIDRSVPLGDGYRVEAELVVARHDDVALVPLGATFRRGAETRVFVLDAEGRARERTLTVLATNATHLGATAGVEPGERVVVHPSDRVRDGVRLSDRAADPP
jgi:HlyD family secretion protein